jgi:hypothetical protein
MIKVKCINKDGWVTERGWLGALLFGRERPVDGPKNNDILHVTGETWENGKKFVFLLEWPLHANEGWQADQFIPFNEDEETDYAVEATNEILSHPKSVTL